MKRTPFSTIFSIDLATLAFFRMCLASICLVDFIRKIPYAAMFFSDEGVLPRAMIIDQPHWYHWSLNYLNGSVTFQIILLLLGACFSLCFFFGARTRLANIFLWVLQLSMLYRNPLITQGGDKLLILLLFWSIFLPLNARYSVDHALDPKPCLEKNILNTASIAILLQASFVWFFSTFIKFTPVWQTGEAVSQVLYAEWISTPLGTTVGQYHSLTIFLTHLTWYVERLAPIALFLPYFHRFFRYTAIICLASMHLGFLLLLNVGHFPFVSLTSLILFLPGEIWTQVSNWLHQRQEKLVMYYDKPCRFCRHTCLILRTFLNLNAEVKPAQEHPIAGPLLLKNNSWVVEDTLSASMHTRWPAMLTVFKRSYLAMPLFFLFRPVFFEKVGEMSYAWVARHRGKIAHVSSFFWKENQCRIINGNHIQYHIVSALLICVIFFNIHNVFLIKKQRMTWGLEYAHWLVAKPLLGSLGLNQIWNMFAPYPVNRNNWVQIRGQLDNNRQFEFFPTYGFVNSKNALAVPKMHISKHYPYFRLRKFYHDSLLSQRRKSYINSMLTYHCHHWHNTYTKLHLKRIALEVYDKPDEAKEMSSTPQHAKVKKQQPYLRIEKSCSLSTNNHKEHFSTNNHKEHFSTNNHKDH
jgi:hypothetical protein